VDPINAVHAIPYTTNGSIRVSYVVVKFHIIIKSLMKLPRKLSRLGLGLNPAGKPISQSIYLESTSICKPYPK
jgi:hypothetical protein